MVIGHEENNSNEPTPPYWYARVLGIFHALVVKTDTNSTFQPQRVDFLWVRWYGHDPAYRFGFRHCRLPRIGFVPTADEDAFGFLDLAEVIRAVHLIPAFAHSKTSELLPPSIARRPSEDDEDWQFYYVNI